MSLFYLVAIAWMYVVVLMAVAEGTAAQGSWLGAFFTLFLYGVLPLGIALYLLAAPARWARHRAAASPSGSAQPDGGSHPAGDAVAPVREEP